MTYVGKPGETDKNDNLTKVLPIKTLFEIEQVMKSYRKEDLFYLSTYITYKISKLSFSENHEVILVPAKNREHIWRTNEAY